MSTELIRTKFSAVAVKIETTIGTDVIGGSPGSDDWIGSDCEVQFDPDVIEIPEYTGTLDGAAPIVGGLKPRLRLRMPIRGSGTAATAPPFGKLLQACTFDLTATGAAVGAPTAAASGTTTTVTAASPFGTTAQTYRGMPLIVTGDQSFTTAITNYTAGRVITMGETRSALTTSSLLQVPINNLYTPTSDESLYKTVTVYLYKDGFLWVFVGCSGTATIELTVGGLAFITFELRAVFSAKSAAAADKAAVAAATAARALIVPPRFVAGKLQLNKATARAKTLTLNAGVEVTLPDDPEGADGYGPSVPVGRQTGGSLDPYMSTATSLALMTAFRAGTSMTLMALLGSTAGNRFLFTLPAVKSVAFDPSEREGLATHGITFRADGADSALYVAAF